MGTTGKRQRPPTDEEVRARLTAELDRLRASAPETPYGRFAARAVTMLMDALADGAGKGCEACGHPFLAHRGGRCVASLARVEDIVVMCGCRRFTS